MCFGHEQYYGLILEGFPYALASLYTVYIYRLLTVASPAISLGNEALANSEVTCDIFPG